MLTQKVKHVPPSSDVSSELEGLFPSCSSRSSSMMQSHEDVITKANRLLTGLRTSPAAILGRRSRSKKKRCRPSFVEKELYKNLVLISWTLSTGSARL